MRRPGRLGRLSRALAIPLRRAERLARAHGRSQARFWFLALAIGTVAGLAALSFRLGIETLQGLLYGTGDIAHLHSDAYDLPWWRLLLPPTLGGLVVGLIVQRFIPDGRVRSVADVIEGAALRGGRVEVKEGLASVAAALVTLGSGGSAGREGPVVNLAAAIWSWTAERLGASGIAGRDLLGCAVAGAVSASFNAPIAGTIFAMEVVLRHSALHAFAPIAIASVMGTLVNRLRYGDVAEFRLSGGTMIGFYWEIPAFLVLGLLSGLVAVVLMRAVFWTDDLASAVQRRTRMPRWLRPTLAGLLVGALSIVAPPVIGIGYEVITWALTGQLTLMAAIWIAVAKTAAVAITLGGRMGGGIFSPSLVLGSMTGLAFGLVATGLIPAYSGSATTYALAGFAATSAAVLGAPVSTTLIVFELTGDWQIAIAVLAAVSTATAVASRLVRRSFFLTQLARRDVRIAQGPQEYLLQSLGVAAAIRPPGSPGAPPLAEAEALVAGGLALDHTALLREALRRFDETGADVLAVTAPADDGSRRLVGTIRHVDALKTFNQALAATAAEEHS